MLETVCTGVQDLRISQPENEERVATHLNTIQASIDLQVPKNDQGYTQKKRNDIARWLSKTPFGDFHALVSSTRLAGTGKWLLESGTFHDWRDKVGSEILWLRGTPGSGKTNLISLVIDDLQETFPDATTYFYCSYSSRERSEITPILRSLLRQLYSNTSGANPIHRLYEDRERDGFVREDLTLQETLDLIKLSLLESPAPRRNFIVLDGLDECDPSSVTQMIQAFKTFISDPRTFVKIIIGSRESADIHLHLEGCSTVNVGPDENSSDIDAFITHEIDKSIKERRLLRGQVNNEVRKSITAMLLEASEGMFLWVRLQIDNICQAKRRSDLRAALHELPRGLEDSYENIFYRILSQIPQYAVFAERIFKWMLYSVEPLTAQAISVAISVEADGSVCDPVDIPLMIDICQNLIWFDQERQELAFIHSTTQAFLARKYESERPHTYLARVCLMTLLLHGDATAVSPQLSWHSSDFIVYVNKVWPIHSARADEHAPDLMTIEYRFMTHVQRYSRWMQCFQLYHKGTKSILPRSGQNYFIKTLTTSITKGRTPSALVSASYFGLVRVVQNLLRLPKHSPFLDDAGRALHVASEAGHASVIALILKAGLVNADIRTSHGMSAAHRAAYMGHLPVMALLFKFGSCDINVVNDFGMTPLLFAIEAGREDMALNLLEVPCINTSQRMTNTGGKSDFDALALASANGLHNVVSRLSTMKKVNLDTRDDIGRTPLMLAALHGHHKVLRRLLSVEVIQMIDVNAQDLQRYTALHHASLKRQEQCVRLLISCSMVNPNLQDQRGRTPLLLALKFRNNPITRLICERKEVDPNIADERGNTALITCAERRFTEDAELLLKTGQVNVHAQNVYGTTALHWAVNSHSNSLLNTILSRCLTRENNDKDHEKIDINTRNAKGCTPLTLAASWGNARAVKTLMQYPGIEIDARDDNGFNALDWALKRNRKKCVELLTKQGVVASSSAIVSRD